MTEDVAGTILPPWFTLALLFSVSLRWILIYSRWNSGTKYLMTLCSDYFKRG